ncbi:MAG: alpha/beta hydrolase [Planctomycetaceae bacterium]|nr:alpha/beta hydrolase [Planctomycetaceae bacterium]
MPPVEHVIRAHDGVELISRRFEPLDPCADGRSLVIVHGASEHGRRYDHVARLFADRGWTVIIGDNRGHGNSGGNPMHVRRFEDYLRDLDAVWQHHKLAPARTAMLGHSFGSLISARFAETRPENLSALVLMAPLLRLKVHVNPLVVAWGKLVSFLVPSVRFETRVDSRDTTRDEVALMARQADPLIHRSVTCGWFFQMKAALNSVWDDVGSLNMPVLVAQGGADRIVEPQVARPWLEKVPSADKELKWFPEHFHELHNEPDWLDVMNSVADWLEERVKCGPAAVVQKAGSETPVS